MKFVIGRTLTILSWDNPVTAYFRKNRKLRHSLGRPSRSDFVQFEFGSDIVYMAMLNAKHVGTRQSSRLLYRPVYKEVFSPPGVTDEPQNVFHDALLNYQKHYLFF